jgi:hypothetical protein
MSKVKDSFFGGAEKRAGRKRAEAQRRAARLTAEQLAQTEKEFAPFLSQQAGPSLQLQQALSGALGQEAQSQAFQQFQESPGVQFAREQGLRLIGSGAGAIGGLGGGERLRELTKFSQGLALQDLGNQFNRLGVTSAGEQALISRQQQATANLANIRSGLGAQQGAAIIGEGQAQAAGIVGQAAGLRGGFQQLGNAAVGAIGAPAGTSRLAGAIKGVFGD